MWACGGAECEKPDVAHYHKSMRNMSKWGPQHPEPRPTPGIVAYLTLTSKVQGLSQPFKVEAFEANRACAEPRRPCLF